MSAKILVVEDDLDLHFILCKMLKKRDYQLQSAYSDGEAKALIGQNKYDLIVLDLMLPEISGEELIGLIRQQQATPIMVISAKTGLEGRVAALENGADDYLTKPFAKEKVLARVGALLRRSRQPMEGTLAPSRLTFKEICMDMEGRHCLVRGKTAVLTAKEFDLLRLLLEQPKKVYTKASLYQELWGEDFIVEDNALNVHISNLRKKLKSLDSSNEYIETVWGIGFKLKD